MLNGRFGGFGACGRSVKHRDFISIAVFKNKPCCPAINYTEHQLSVLTKIDGGKDKNKCK